MLKKKILKVIFVLTCIMTMIMPYTSVVLAAALTHEDTTATLEVLRIHKGGEEASGTLSQEQEKYYDTTPYGYKVGDTRVFKIITQGDTNYENTFYCLNAKKSFPGVTSSGYEPKEFEKVADLKDSSDANVKALHLSTSNSADSTTWNANYKSLIWLINNMYLPNQTPEQKDAYLSKAFDGTGEDLDTVKALLTDDDIDVVQQYVMWYFTNRDSAEFNVSTYPAVNLTRYNLDSTETTGSYGDFTPSTFPGEISYSLRQDFANILYNYLKASAISAMETSVTFPVIENTSATPYSTTLDNGYYVAGPFKVKSGTANQSEYEIKLIDENNNEIARSEYEILIDGESNFSNKNLKEIFDTNYYICIREDNTNINKFSLSISYKDYETEASLWKNSSVDASGVEIYQPVVLITRDKTPHIQKQEVEIERKTADLALRKYIVSVNGTNVNRTPEVDVSGLKSGSSKTAEYKHAKNPVEVSVGDKVVYEIRIYNEGDIAGTADSIVDSLPKGLKFAENSTINDTYGWTKSIATTSNKINYSTEYLKTETIDAYDRISDVLPSKYVQIECEITDEVSPSTVLTNVAEIGSDSIDDIDSTPYNNNYVKDDIDSTNYTGDVNNKQDLSDKDYYYKGIEDDDDFEKVVIKGKAFDLSLKKFITRVNKTAPSLSREPKVDVTKLKDGTSTDATYTTVKNPVTVKKGDIVFYTLRVYNEGEISGYAEEVADYLPEGLGFLVNHTTNVDNYWSIPTNATVVKLSTIENGTTNLSIDDFNGITDLSNVDVVVGNAKLVSTKLKSSTVDTKNLIKAFDKSTGTKLDYKDIQVACIVLADKAENNNFKNIAEIMKETDENRVDITDRDSTPDSVDTNNYPGQDSTQDDHDYEDLMTEDPKIFDLALQKFITKLNETEIKDRVPTVSKNDDGTIRYSHASDALSVCYNDLVTFTIRVYNEGDYAGYAKEVLDYLPKEGLEFVADNEVNKKYGWKLYDSNGNQTDKVDQAVTVRTKYLSKEESEKRSDNSLIKAFDKTKNVDSTNPDYKDIQIVFKVTAKVSPENKDSITKKEFLNKAEIFDDEDENGNPIDDRDSVPNNNKDGEDDIDQDKIRVRYFDLRLSKDLVKIIITEDGKTREVNVSNTNALQKVEINRRKINSTTVKFVYNITVTNEGEIAGYATEIKDYIPAGLEFIAEENKGWTKVSDDVITTNALAETLLEPGKSASVQVTLKWKNAEDNMGLKTNIAEISADKNDSGTPDIDSTPNNKKDGEDDIDKAEVMLQISTGSVQPKYMLLSTTVLVIWTTGIILIKKYVL